MAGKRALVCNISVSEIKQVVNFLFGLNVWNSLKEFQAANARLDVVRGGEAVLQTSDFDRHNIHLSKTVFARQVSFPPE